MGRRKVSLSWRPVFSCRRSLHSDGLTEHARGRLCDRTPPMVSHPSVVMHSAFWCVATTLRATIRIRSPYPAAAQSSQAVGEEETTSAPPFQDGVGDSGGGDTSGDSGGTWRKLNADK